MHPKGPLLARSLVALILLAGLLAGCGGESQSGGGSQSDSGEQQQGGQYGSDDAAHEDSSEG